MIRLFWVGLILTSFFSTCQDQEVDKGEVVASVYGKNLYKTDLESISFDGIGYNDSIVRARAFIDKWIRNQLLIYQAENNLNAADLDFSKELESYHNSLIINKYETELVSQNLNTEVSEEEILDYYKNNSGNFRLNRNILKYISVTIDNKSRFKRVFTVLLRDHDSLLIDSITSLADRRALSYNTDLSQWHNFDDFAKAHGITADNQEAFLDENRFLIFNNEGEITLLRISEYRKIGEESPSEFETNRIKFIILSNRKKKLLDKLYDDLYTKALRDNAFEIF